MGKRKDCRFLSQYVCSRRNMFSLTFSVIIARLLGIRNVVISVSQSDYGGYPDCRVSLFVM
ncbi:MAG: 7-cyano-7-deazaguanine synthase [Bacteroidales bacterium OttesenSCG-928-I14]|nr:7-cyano-7-deazaguanine synthase [Bacteroidales bacterium OttesenSCG-928-I14]